MEEPPAKRLKSDMVNSPLPNGWTEHTAPSGHKYYYNKSLKKSTYSRPTSASVPAHPLPSKPPPVDYVAHTGSLQPASGGGEPAHVNGQQFNGLQPYQDLSQTQANGSNEGLLVGMQPTRPATEYYRPPKRHAEDRPKSKVIIPDCGSWILVYTKLGRRFVHNTETQESLWKFPPDVMTAVITYDQQQLEAKYGPRKPNGTDRQAKTEATVHGPVESDQSAAQKQPTAAEQKALADYEAQRAASLAREKDEDAKLLAEEQEERVWVPPFQSAVAAAGYDSSEYEEVEVTDTEGEDSDVDREPQQVDDAPIEFNEDDIAYQLAAMGEEYGLDTDNQDDEEYENEYDAEENDPIEAALSEEDRYFLFAEMLLAYGISPYTPWETLIDSEQPHAMMADDRFTVVPSSRGRKEAFDRWCRERIAQLKEERAQVADKADDARVIFLRFLAEREKEVRKLYWIEFRRKYKREVAVKGAGRFADKEMEKVYREFKEKAKSDTGRREKDFRTLLDEARRKGGEGPEVREKVRGDTRFWIYDNRDRDDKLEALLSTL